MAWTDSSFGPYSNVQQLAKMSPGVMETAIFIPHIWACKIQARLFKPIYNRTFPYTILIYYNSDNPNVLSIVKSVT